jgi:hypothetical protein
MRGLMRYPILRLAIVLVFSSACGGDDQAGMPPPSPPPPSVDAEAGALDGGDGAALDAMPGDASLDAPSTDGRMDGSEPDAEPIDASMDAVPMDGSSDASLMDASHDGGGDARSMDSSAGDAGTPGDASADAMDEWMVPTDDAGHSEGHRCYRLGPGTACGAGGSCALGYRCTDSLCGDFRCLPAGRPCAVPEDCPTGSDCTTIGSPPDEARVCWRATGCADSRDCQMGFSCEAGSCVDRRIPCQPAPNTCPLGMVCVGHDFGTGSFCARVAHACRETALCPVAGSICVDVIGSGRFQCGLTGMCMTSSECAGRQVCGTDPDFYYAACMDYGPCGRASDCPAGMLCRDLAGDTLSECVAAGGTCSQDSDCPVRQVCATALRGSAPACTIRSF